MEATPLQLFVRTGSRAGEVIDLTREWLVLGRDPGCDVVLDDEGVAPQHAAIGRLPDGSYEVGDLGSSTGTFVDGVRITEATALRGGEELRIGDTVFHVSQATAGGPSPRGPWKWLAIGVAAVAIAALGAALAIVFIGDGEASSDKAIATPTGTEVATATGEITIPPALTETVTVTETVPSEEATTATEPATTDTPTEPATTEAPPPTTEEPTTPETTTPTEPGTTEEPTTPTDPATTGDDGGGEADPEAELLAHVPADIRESCRTQMDVQPQGSLASVVCSAPDGESRVVYWQFDDARSMRAWYAGYLAGSGAEPDTGDCVDDEVAEQPWTTDEEPGGRALCAPAADRDLRAIAWTHDGLTIGSIAATSGLDQAARERVHEFWLVAGPTP